MFCGHDAVAGVIKKRSDDANPLQQVVQQQSLDIQRQAAELTALKDTVTVQHNTVTDLQNIVTSLQSTNQQLTIKANKNVAFTVYASKDPITTENQGVFVFDTVVSNIGNGYDTHTGIFTAPYSGTYLFLANIMTNTITARVAIDKGGTVIAQAYATKNNSWDKDTCHATVHLNSGDKVWLRHINDDKTLVGNVWTTFSGMLLHAD